MRINYLDVQNMLNGNEIKQLIEEKELVSNYCKLDTQLTQNGIDLTMAEIFMFEEAGQIDFSNSERETPECEKVNPKKEKESDDYGWWKLEPGVYKIRTNEILSIPNDMAGFALPRTSLLRMGVSVENGFWEAGFSGRSEALLNVGNPYGVNVKENARVIQMAFFYINEVEEGYEGVYKDI